MARGTVVGEGVVSQASTEEFREGYERTFGDKKAERGRWVYDEAQQKLVRAEEYQAPERAVDAPILAGRFYEGVKAVDGEDIGSRAKHRDYMRRHGVTSFSDFGPDYAERQQRKKREEERRSLRTTLERKFHEINDKPGRK